MQERDFIRFSSASAERLAKIIDGVPNGVVAIDGNFRIEFMNLAAERLFGVKREKAIGSNCKEFIGTELCENDCPIEGYRKKGAKYKPVLRKTVCVKRSGEKFPASVSTNVFTDENGEALGAVETFRDLRTVEILRKKLDRNSSFEGMIGKSPAMRKVFDLIKIVAKSESTVLIQGESGSGKELTARAIHSLSSRKDKPFVAINCSAIPESLLESELFGYKAGAFTDAKKDKPGLFAKADKGTLFLDEIGDISKSLQVKLLRVLQESEYYPLGSATPEKADVRIIAATNKDLKKMTKTGEIRPDFYYRINVININLPPLRERKEDIPLLVNHFIDKFNKMYGGKIEDISPEALKALMNYDFPGNARELENVVERGFVLAQGRIIKKEHLPENLQESKPVPVIEIASSMREMEAIYIMAALKRNGWNRKKTAADLNIDPSTLYRKMKKLGLKPPRK